MIDNLDLPDKDDRHVLAAAIRAQVQVIVTFNLKDFPERSWKLFDLEAQHPDVFLRNQIGLSPDRFLFCIKTIRNRLKHPPMTSQEYLEVLLAQNLPQTVAFLKDYVDLI